MNISMIKSLINYRYELYAFLSIIFYKMWHDPIYLVFLCYGLLGMLARTLKPTINIMVTDAKTMIVAWQKINDYLEKNE